MDKHRTSLLMSRVGIRLLKDTAKKMGISQAAVIETAVREIAARQNIDIEKVIAETGVGVR